MSVKNTILEQSVNMYSLDDNDIQYWNDWAKRLIECCQNHLGWEVTQGPGTSLGNIIPGAYENMGYNYCYYNFLTSGSYDCDWTKANGIVDKWKNTTLTVEPRRSTFFGLGKSARRFTEPVVMSMSPLIVSTWPVSL